MEFNSSIRSLAPPAISQKSNKITSATVDGAVGG